VIIDCTINTDWSNDQVTTNGGTNLDQSPIIDDYHAISTSSAREAYTAWTDHRDVINAANYDIYANRDPTFIDILSYATTGSSISGMSVSVYDSHNNLVTSGYTPMTVEVNSGGTYTVDLDSYGSNQCTSAGDYPAVTSYSVASWGCQATINAPSDGSIVVNGYYGTNSGSSNNLQVSSADMNDNSLTGFYIQLQNSGGTQIGTGFTPVTFSSLGQGTYYVYANSYCNNHTLYSPNRWGDGTTGIKDTISLNYNTNIKVYYSTSSC
jgi:hypothetical protein